MTRGRLLPANSGTAHFDSHLAGLEGLAAVDILNFGLGLGNPQVTPDVKRTIAEGVLHEAAGRTVDQLAQAENRVIIGLLKLRAETGLNKESTQSIARLK